MRRSVVLVSLLMVASAVLGATVLREPIAQAAERFTNVIVGNGPSQPVPVYDTPTEPYQVQLTCGFSGTNGCGDSKTVPAGKRFIIQTVAGHVSGGTRRLSIAIRSNQQGIIQDIEYSLAATTTDDPVADARQVTLYADTLIFMTARANALTSGTGTVALMGYLVPIS